MASNNVVVPIQRAVKGMTLNVKVTGLRVFWARWWIARHLIELAARVAGCGIRIDR